MTQHRIADLHDTPEHLPEVARWIHDEFWLDKHEFSVDSLAVELAKSSSCDAIPLSLLAFADDKPIGTINLIENDDEKRTHLRPWLAALYVQPNARHHGVGSALVYELARRAAALGIGELYLGTDNSGFYARLGATVREEVTDIFCIMNLRTSVAGASPFAP